VKRTSLRRSSPKPRLYHSTGPTPATALLVRARAGMCCEHCGVRVGPVRGEDHHIHHRRARKLGGSRDAATNLASNLLLLCPSSHEYIESNRAEAYGFGWLVRMAQDPAEVPVLVGNGRRLLYLTDDGRYRIEPPAVAS
jgi:hypothetical protein